MDLGVISQQLKPYVELSQEQLKTISTYIDLLLKWNARVNLTAVRDPEQMVTRHFGESFFVARHLIPRDWAGTVIDVGSGAGFPGLPMAIWAPGAEVMLIESNGKKAAFLNEVIHALGLKNARVWNGRAEFFDSQADLVTMRAVEKFELALQTASDLVKPSGRLGVMIGASQVAIARGTGNFLWQESVAIPGGHSRVLVTGTRAERVE
jgi:16S rRNA (guanine527-N7)-methyltransferase